MALEQVIRALNILALSAKMVPLIGGMLEGAAATASQICTIVQVSNALLRKDLNSCKRFRAFKIIK